MPSPVGQSTGAVPSVEEVARISEASRRTVDELAGLLGALDDTAVPIPRSEWTVGETGAHLAFAAIGFSMFARGLFYPYGDGTPQGLADANEVALMGFTERDGRELAHHLTEATRNFLAEVENRAPDQNCPSPLGEMPLGTLASYFLAHNLMHGCAITAALNEDFAFRPEHLEYIWPFLRYAYEGPVLDPEALGDTAACIEFSVADAFDFALVFADGSASFTRTSPGTPDCCIEVDAVHLFLIFIKMLTVQEAIDLGRLTVSGPDPGLALRFMDFFYVP